MRQKREIISQIFWIGKVIWGIIGTCPAGRFTDGKFERQFSSRRHFESRPRAVGKKEMTARVSIFDENLDDRNADEVLLARWDEKEHGVPFIRYVELISAIIRAKVTGVLESYKHGDGIDDDELADCALFLQEIVTGIDFTVRQLIELFRAAVIDQARREDMARLAKYEARQNGVMVAAPKSHERRGRPKTYNKRPKLATLA